MRTGDGRDWERKIRISLATAPWGNPQNQGRRPRRSLEPSLHPSDFSRGRICSDDTIGFCDSVPSEQDIETESRWDEGVPVTKVIIPLPSPVSSFPGGPVVKYPPANAEMWV